MPTLTNSRSRLLGGGRLAVPVPALGAELIVNGGFDADTTWNKDSGWSISGGVAVRVPDASATNVSQSVLTTGTWYLAQFTVTAISAGNLRALLGSTQPATTRTTTGTYYDVMRASNAVAGLRAVAATNGSVDNISYKPITLASMFSTRPYGTHVTVKAAATVVAGTRAGVVCNLDSATSPANFVIASHDGANCRLTKCVAGTYTELISTAVTYVAGAAVEIRRPAGGDIWQLFYNGSQVGTNQTISDAAIKAATLAGLFNSYSGNSLAAFSCVPSA